MCWTMGSHALTKAGAMLELCCCACEAAHHLLQGTGAVSETTSSRFVSQHVATCKCQIQSGGVLQAPLRSPHGVFHKVLALHWRNKADIIKARMKDSKTKVPEGVAKHVRSCVIQPCWCCALVATGSCAGHAV